MVPLATMGVTYLSLKGLSFLSEDIKLLNMTPPQKEIPNINSD